MKPSNTSRGDGKNQGEGDRISARHYNRNLREYIAEENVDEAARVAERYVEEHPDEAKRAEAKARRGPQGTRVSVDELIEKGRTVIDRVKPYVERAAAKLRSRFGRH